ncbi:unnamed protein product [Didymodactylos carnosus]|uniref:G-protein coupled receptors family 1 profile domain-containing protein n=1 Tax=Didymodactylos carnosus TaxID=1234261 RepID=A0A814X403_9BILA|nr:unnamed protein product [Didymodactylos carnosus]CAF1374145.1 unnamed protein product [Didymodactylos carnosus]CAF3974685.1 unnamed protein product [Didymodactylos carnosus]CAF4183065.1 unnamed protein product [Didymodactylos carnosus]
MVYQSCFFIIFLRTFAPVFKKRIIIILLTYNNIRFGRRSIAPYEGQSRKHLRLEFQLTSMLMMQVIAFIVSSFPYGAQSIYSLSTANTEKESERRTWEILATQLTTLTWYITYVSPFYVFLLSSKTFRHQVKNILKMALKTIGYQRETMVSNERAISTQGQREIPLRQYTMQ